jgi:hypothetical protein
MRVGYVGVEQACRMRRSKKTTTSPVDAARFVSLRAETAGKATEQTIVHA